MTKAIIFAALSGLVVVTPTVAQTTTETCVPITSSTQCSAFTPFSVSTDSFLVGLYPFLKNVQDAATFDTQLAAYVNTSYVTLKYQTLFGCQNILLTNTTDLYARYTKSVICNGVIQNSKDRCSLSAAQSRPLCADSCAQQALSESVIGTNPKLCLNPTNYTDTQIRADFTNCALPAESLQNGACVEGYVNEPSNCGFGSSRLGLCTYCSQSSNDTCCASSQADTRCDNVAVPTSISSISLPTAMSTSISGSGSSSPTSTGGRATGTSGAASSSGMEKSSGGGLSSTDIGVIVVGVVVGVILIALLIILLLCCRRRRRDRSGRNVPTSVYKKEALETQSNLDLDNAQFPQPPKPTTEYTVLPGGRIARRSVFIEQTEDAAGVAKNKRLSQRSKELTGEEKTVPTTSPKQDPTTEYTILPGGRMARLSMSSKAPARADAPAPDAAYEPFPQFETSVYTVPKEPRPTSAGSTHHHVSEQSRPKSGNLALISEPPQASSPRSSIHGKIFPYPLAFLDYKDGGPDASKKSNYPPSLSAASLKNDYEFLPGGRFARKHTPMPSTATTDAEDTKKNFKRPLSKAKGSMAPSEGYTTLPGGRIVRTQAMGNQTHNTGLKVPSPSKIDRIKSSTLGVGAAAVESAARLRQSDEESQRGAIAAQDQEGKASETKTEEPKDQESQDQDSEAKGKGKAEIPQDEESQDQDPKSENIDQKPDLPRLPSDYLSELASASDPNAPSASTIAVPSFRDAYSGTALHAGDLVAAVWAYQPQTADEFALERGDMIEIVKIWQDGWATGRFSSDRVDAWEAKHGILIDTDLIEMEERIAEVRKEKEKVDVVKAFPLVCVCAPRYWRKAIREAN